MTGQPAQAAQPAVKRTATQRLEDAEQVLLQAIQTINMQSRDILTLKDAVKLLGNKLDAIVKASVGGEPLNDEVLSRIMVENNIEELKQKIVNLVNAGALTASEVTTETSFIVGEETDEFDEVVNPRLQFAVTALNPEARIKVLGAKAGDTVSFGDNTRGLRLLEVYEIGAPKSSDVVPAAPAEVASSSAETLAPAPAPEAVAAPVAEVTPAEAAPQA